MRRAGFVLIVLVAAAIALEPLIHTHPLTQSWRGAPCAVCVTAVGPLTSLNPAPAAPLTIVTAVPLPPVAAIIQRSAIPLPSRAPPAA